MQVRGRDRAQGADRFSPEEKVVTAISAAELPTARSVSAARAVFGLSFLQVDRGNHFGSRFANIPLHPNRKKRGGRWWGWLDYNRCPQSNRVANLLADLEVRSLHQPCYSDSPGQIFRTDMGQ
jgi:hypothetical protein